MFIQKIARQKLFLKRTGLFVFLVVFVFGGYFLYQFRDFLFGPRISINNLEEYNTVNNSFFEVKGTTKNISNFFLNGRKIFTDENGGFKENMLLASGINIIQIKADDKFGHQIIKHYYVYNVN